MPGGRLGDRRGAVLILALGVACFGIAHAGMAFTGASILALALFFAAAGIAIGFVETAEHAAVASLAPADLRGSAFGLLAAVQSFGNLAASALAGLLWTTISPRAAFLYLAGWMVLALLDSPAPPDSDQAHRQPQVRKREVSPDLKSKWI